MKHSFLSFISLILFSCNKYDYVCDDLKSLDGIRYEKYTDKLANGYQNGINIKPVKEQKTTTKMNFQLENDITIMKNN